MIEITQWIISGVQDVFSRNFFEKREVLVKSGREALHSYVQTANGDATGQGTVAEPLEVNGARLALSQV